MPSFFSDVDRLSLLTLNCLNLKPAKLGSWLTHYKHPSQILDNLCENTVSSKQIQTARKIAERELVEVEKNSFTILYYGETSYPKLLTEIPDPPPVLYLWGSIPTQSAITLVGTRRPSPYGLTTAEDFSASLTKNGICIVSGLATGIDQSVLQSAVDANGSALAVLGSGLLNIYPKGNISLAKKIVETGGGVISEFGLHIGLMKQNFPRRNRIMAAIASGVCVIEAPERSGALITARLACDYNRLVWAVPNMITSRSF
ncbi:MAG: DNA-protecting protein DprA, partial [Candidatus Lindowbacteria bacterium]|nr:DNA-protecting protein DprA [Candidatus Lindowbacteria bacterium]